MRFKFVVILFYFMNTLVVVFINHEIGAYAQSSSSTQLIPQERTNIELRKCLETADHPSMLYFLYTLS